MTNLSATVAGCYGRSDDRLDGGSSFLIDNFVEGIGGRVSAGNVNWHQVASDAVCCDVATVDLHGRLRYVRPQYSSVPA